MNERKQIHEKQYREKTYERQKLVDDKTDERKKIQ